MICFTLFASNSILSFTIMYCYSPYMTLFLCMKSRASPLGFSYCSFSWGIIPGSGTAPDTGGNAESEEHYVSFFNYMPESVTKL
ncbi:hypothetical protein D1970_12405 [Mesobacillus zeae]|uniref:Uncharacterized protein n=1 Tax=Mesobacillus zeae TaxID=1917180 RepID=A0A398B3U3_9BACI|nr:hypothetical protein D1970_12405 [Mesobacillus zeae]